MTSSLTTVQFLVAIPTTECLMADMFLELRGPIKGGIIGAPF
jgi:hypothetical protein